MSYPILKVQDEWFHLIKNGAKKIEGRVNNPAKDYFKWQPGEIILVKMVDTNGLEITDEQPYLIKLIDKKYYANFTDMLSIEGIRNILPTRNTVEEGLLVYGKYFPTEYVNTYGVVALHVELF